MAELLEVLSLPASLDAAAASVVLNHQGYTKATELLLRQLQVSEWWTADAMLLRWQRAWLSHGRQTSCCVSGLPTVCMVLPRTTAACLPPNRTEPWRQLELSVGLHGALKCCGLRVQREVAEMQHGARSRAVVDAAADIVGISEELLEAAGTWESKLSLWKQVRLDMHFPHGLHPKRAAGGPFRPWIQR